MVNGSRLAEQFLQHLVPKYNQSAKEYADLTGKNTFVLIGAEPPTFKEFVSALYQNSLQPIGQMIVEDWNANLAAIKARYIAFKTDGSPYNTANFFLGGIPDAVVSIYNGYAQRYVTLRQNQNSSSFLNWFIRICTAGASKPPRAISMWSCSRNTSLSWRL